MSATLTAANELPFTSNPMLHPVTQVGALRFKLRPYVDVLRRFNDSSSGDFCMTVHGAFRCGKTTFMRFLIRHFNRNKEMVVFHSFQESGGESRRSSAAGMPRLARELRTSRVGDTPLRSLSEVEALIRVMQMESEKAGTKRILLLIDEAQYLSLEQLIGLKALLEKLIGCELVPFVVLFAQPEIMAYRQRLMNAGEISLVDRFFLNMHRLRGLTQAEMGGLLRQFDEHRWPEQGGPTYTQFFMPTAWENGLRLAAQSMRFCRAFTDVCKDYKRDAEDIPVKYIVHAATRLLRTGEQALASGSDLSDLVSECVENSGIVESFQSGHLERLAHMGKTRAKRAAA